MAINKVVNKRTNSHGAMRNVIEYVLQDKKVKDGYVEILGPYDADTITWDDVYRNWIDEKRLWKKDSGRMYTHNIISFHKDEKITPEEVLEIGREFADKFFAGHQCLIGVHQDKDHLHCHLVTNTVSFIDGKKLHQTKKDLAKQKEYTNQLCIDRGLTVAEKGKHFEGTLMDEGEMIAWDKDKYNLLINDSKKSYIAECGMALFTVIPKSSNKEEFISGIAAQGWTVHWNDKRKHIVFENKEGKKVRDTNISKTFSMDISKEALLYEFERQNNISRRTQTRKTDERNVRETFDNRKAAILPEVNKGTRIKEKESISNHGVSKASVKEKPSIIDKIDKYNKQIEKTERKTHKNQERKKMERTL